MIRRISLCVILSLIVVPIIVLQTKHLHDNLSKILSPNAFYEDETVNDIERRMMEASDPVLVTETTVNSTSNVTEPPPTKTTSTYLPPLSIFPVKPMVYFDQSPFITADNNSNTSVIPMTSSVVSSFTLHLPSSSSNATMMPVMNVMHVVSLVTPSSTTTTTPRPTVETTTSTTPIPPKNNISITRNIDENPLKVSMTTLINQTIESTTLVPQVSLSTTPANEMPNPNVSLNFAATNKSIEATRQPLKRTALIENFLDSSASDVLLNSSSPECKEQLEKTDDCMKRIFMFEEDARNFTFPRTFEQLDSIYCKNLNETLKCVGGYAKCLSRIPRIIYHLVYYHIKQTIQHNICKEDKFREDMLVHGRCFQIKSDMRVIRNILDEGTLASLYILKHVSSKEIVPWGCCAFMKVFEDGKSKVDNLCRDRTGNETGQFFMDFMKSAATDVLELGCRKYSSTQACDKNLPEAMGVFNQLISGHIPAQKYTPILPLIEIARRLAERIDDGP